MKKSSLLFLAILLLLGSGIALKITVDKFQKNRPENTAIAFFEDTVRFKIKDTVFVVPRKYLYFPNVKKFERNSAGIDLWWPSMEDLKSPQDDNVRVSFYFMYHETDKPADFIIQRLMNEDRLKNATDTYGLKGYQLLNSVNKEPLRDIFVREKDGIPIGYIRCSLLSKTNNPQCKYMIDHEGFVFGISLDRDLLPQWEKIESDVFKFFDTLKEKT